MWYVNGHGGKGARNRCLCFGSVPFPDWQGIVAVLAVAPRLLAMQLFMNRNSTCNLLCTEELDKDQQDKFESYINHGYNVHW